jgi:hypothetical protein
MRLNPTRLEALVDKYLTANVFHLASSSSSSPAVQTPLTPSPANRNFFVRSISKAHVTNSDIRADTNLLMSNPHADSITRISIPTASIHKPVEALLRAPGPISLDLSPTPHTIPPSTLSAWIAGTRNVPSIKLHGLTIENPSILSTPSIPESHLSTPQPGHASYSSTLAHSSTPVPRTMDFPIFSAISVSPPPDGFVLTGDVSLFGIPGLKGSFIIV